MGMMTEFKEFAMRGNVIDLAVGVVIGASFGKIVSALVDKVIMPPIGLFIGGVDFAKLGVVLKEATVDAAGKEVPAVVLAYGEFINALIQFVIVAFAIFLVVKAINRIHTQARGSAGRDPGRRAAAARDPRFAEELNARPPAHLRRSREAYTRGFVVSGNTHASHAACHRPAPCWSPCPCMRSGATRIDDSAMAQAATLRDAALADDTGWKVVESLTTEVGPRLAGSEADARAVEWAKAKFKALGYDKVWTEPVTFPKWERRSESARDASVRMRSRCTSPRLAAVRAARSRPRWCASTRSTALEKAAPGSLAGKIAFVDYRMTRAKDGRGYGPGSRVRSGGPSAAIRAGAIALRDALGRHRLASQPAYRHHPLR